MCSPERSKSYTHMVGLRVSKLWDHFHWVYYPFKVWTDCCLPSSFHMLPFVSINTASDILRGFLFDCPFLENKLKLSNLSCIDLTGIVQLVKNPKLMEINILLSFTHLHAVPNPYDFLSAVEHKMVFLTECSCSFFPNDKSIQWLVMFKLWKRHKRTIIVS